ncbi:Septal ring factor [Urinicoccus massiliensis]|uniref:Septal ring factor n=1 Tax=Urinicoccus massiliensis TaxID=1723382 RepID=A0A8H2R0Y9_9FIRM|nr:peptidoglycan DD-metalloendopeptidase family protein [Urinicoccus massiliensis]VFB16138.1 Septal ring factor [Urinicoccus massiliensis]
MKHKDWLQRGLCSLLILTSLAPGAVYASSKDLQKAQDQKKAIQEQLNKKQSVINSTKAEVSSVAEEIKDLDLSITSASAELFSLMDNIKALEGDIAKAQKELDQAQAELKKFQDAFAQRIKVMYVKGDIGYLDVLLNSQDMESFLTNIELIKSINRQDRKLVAKIKTQVDIIRAKKEELTQKKSALEGQKAQVEEKKRALEEANQAKQNYMVNLKGDLSAYEEDYDEMLKESKQLEARIQKIKNDIQEQKRLAELKRKAQEKANKAKRAGASGRVTELPMASSPYVRSNKSLTWPVPGHSRISSPFGYRIHPVLGTQRFHSGIDIPAPVGTPIVAAKPGIVITASYMGSYGNVVMIDHGDIVTVYGHNSVLKVSVGQQVSAGQVIALAGSTGRSTGPHCHFEVRVGGRPVNPLGFV